MQDRDVERYLSMALECSIFLSPRAPGLSHEELREVGAQLRFMPGEVNDAMGYAFRSVRLKPGRDDMGPPNEDLGMFIHLQRPDYRNPKAFDVIVVYLRDLARSAGRANAKVPRDVLVAEAVAKGIPELDIEAAITIWLLDNTLEENGGLISFRGGQALSFLPSQQLAEMAAEGEHVFEREGLAEVYRIVKDVIARRADGRPPAAEPAKAFEAALNGLGYGHFRTWWAQTMSEYRRSNDAVAPTSSCVLAAALSEAALIFVVARAQKANVGPLLSATFRSDPPTQWKFEDLIKSAAAGGQHAILDQRTRERAERLNKSRQRIHVGRLMHENPKGPIPDIRPEEVRDARETLDAVLRCIVDWLQAHPANPAS